jgi:hypothetical protein
MIAEKKAVEKVDVLFNSLPSNFCGSDTYPELREHLPEIPIIPWWTIDEVLNELYFVD